MYRSTVASLAAEIGYPPGFLDSFHQALMREVEAHHRVLGGALRFLPVAAKKRLIYRGYAAEALPTLVRFIHQHSRLVSIVTDDHGAEPSDAEHRYRCLCWFFDMCARYQIIREALGGEHVLVMNEGFCQRATALLLGDGGVFRAHRLADYIEQIPKPGLVFWVEAEPPTCMERMAGREKRLPIHLREMGENEMIDHLGRVREFIVLMTKALENRRVKVARIDNNGSREQSLESVRRWCDAYVRSGS